MLLNPHLWGPFLESSCQAFALLSTPDPLPPSSTPSSLYPHPQPQGSPAQALSEHWVPISSQRWDPPEGGAVSSPPDRLCYLLHLLCSPPAAKGKTFESENSLKKEGFWSQFPISTHVWSAGRGGGSPAEEDTMIQTSLHPVGSRWLLEVETGKRKKRN